MVMNGFDTNFDRSNEVYAVNTVAFAYMDRADPGQARRAGADLPRQRARVRPRQLVPRARQLLRLLPDRHVARAARVHRHGRSRARASAGSSSCASRTPASTCSTPTCPSSPSSAGWASSRWWTDGGRPGHGATPTAAPAWALGLVPLLMLAAAIGLFVALDAPGLDRNGVAGRGAGGRAHRAAAGRDRAARAQRRPRPVRVEQVIVNDGVRVVHARRDAELGRLEGSEITVDYPWIEGEDYEVVLLTATGATDRPRDRRRRGDARRGSRLLRADGADRAVRRA